MKSWPEDRVKDYLERVLASPEFVSSPKLSQFLDYVVDKAVTGHEHKIKQYTIAVEALGYRKEFDPNTNPSVRIMARRLRRSLTRYYLNSGAADPIRIKLPKGGYVPVLVDNSKAEKPIAVETTPVVPATGPQEFAEPTIAVFEFECLSDQDSDSHIAVGMTAEILVALARFTCFSVLGPLAYETGQPLDFQQVRREYGALFALQGWIQRSGSIVRISIDLMDTRTTKIQWARNFDYDLDKTTLFEIEDEITSQVTGELADGSGIIFKELISDSYREHTKFSDTALAILAYNKAWAIQSPQDWKTANMAVSKALASRPENALMLALQSNIYYRDVIDGLSLVVDPLSKMKALAQKAVSLDPELQIAQYNLVVQSAFFGKARQCVEATRKVVAMNPNHARILAGCAIATTSVGAYELGLDLIQRAKRLNPHYPSWYFFVNYLVEFHKEQYEQAWAHAQLIHVRGLLWHPLLRVAVLGKLDRADDATPYIVELLQNKPDFLQRPREYIRPIFVTDKHIDMIWDGLQKAGLAAAKRERRIVNTGLSC